MKVCKSSDFTTVFFVISFIPVFLLLLLEFFDYNYNYIDINKILDPADFLYLPIAILISILIFTLFTVIGSVFTYFLVRKLTLKCVSLGEFILDDYHSTGSGVRVRLDSIHSVVIRRRDFYMSLMIHYKDGTSEEFAPIFTLYLYRPFSSKEYNSVLNEAKELFGKKLKYK